MVSAMAAIKLSIRPDPVRIGGEAIESSAFSGNWSAQSANARIAVQSGSPYSSMSSRATSPAIDVSVGAFDAIVNLFTSFGYFADPDDDRRVLENAFRSLRPGGTMLLATGV